MSEQKDFSDKLRTITWLIKQKKELSTVDDEIVLEELTKFLKKENLLKRVETLSFFDDKKKLLKNAFIKRVIKNVRNELNKSYGFFISKKSIKKKYIYLEELKILISLPRYTKEQFIKLHNKLLSCHASTKERLQIYPNLYNSIFKITGKPSSIMDLGCGLNPISLPYLNLSGIEYFASELNKADCDFLREYFSIVKNEFNLKYHVKQINLLDILKKDIFSKMKKYDICFLFKVTDTLEKGKGHKITEVLLERIPAKWIVLSFSLRTARDRPMRHPYRGWVERMLGRVGYNFFLLEPGNEIFYIIKK